MSYANQTQDFGRRATAIAGVAIIHAAIGLGLVVGLTVTGMTPAVDTWDPFEITPDPLPKPPPPEPQKQQETQKTLVTVPPTPYDPPAKSDSWVTVDPVPDDNPFVVDPGPAVQQPVDSRPMPAFTPRGARPRNDPSGWLSTDDYPRAPLVDGVEGTAGYRLIVATSGRVSACEITRSTGNDKLDQATCRFILRRARFEAATDETGAKVLGSYTGTVRWEIPD
jgi:protein TonB